MKKEVLRNTDFVHHKSIKKTMNLLTMKINKVLILLRNQTKEKVHFLKMIPMFHFFLIMLLQTKQFH